eukprot:3200648-Amphidinium_carterae.1
MSRNFGALDCRLVLWGLFLCLGSACPSACEPEAWLASLRFLEGLRSFQFWPCLCQEPLFQEEFAVEPPHLVVPFQAIGSDTGASGLRRGAWSLLRD